MYFDLLDGGPRKLEFGSLALGRFELLICNGIGLHQTIANHLYARPPYYLISGLLWAGLNDESLSHADVCQMFDNYLLKSGDLYDGKIWVAIVEALRDYGFFKNKAEIRQPVAPLRDPEPEVIKPKARRKKTKLKAVPELKATDKEYDDRIARLKKERKDWKRQMGANL